MSFREELAIALNAVDFDAKGFADFLLQSARLIFIGNGGSAAIASHMANDFSKNGDYPALCFNDPASLTCLANDLGYEHVFSHPIEKHVRGPDCIIAISSSGKSANVIAGVYAAKKRGASIATFSGFAPGNPLSELGDVNFHVKSFDYGIVETAHLAMLHATLREFRA